MIKEILDKISAREEQDDKESVVEKEAPASNAENIKQTKTEILKKVLSEVSLFAKKIKNLESDLYKKEQVTEAAAGEAILEKADEEKQAVAIDEEGKEVTEKPEESTFFKILKNALGLVLILLPVLFKGFEDIKKVFGDLPNIISDSFKNIISSLFDKLQTSISTYVFDPIKNYFSSTVTELWQSLVATIEETIGSIVSSLPAFLQEKLPEAIESMLPGAAKGVAKGEEPGKEPEVQMTVGSTGSFGVTGKPAFGGEYSPPEYGAPAAPPEPPAAAEVATTTEPPGAATRVEAGGTTSRAQEQVIRIPPEKIKEDATKEKPSANFTGNAKKLASELRRMGIVNENAIAAIIATAAKESGLNPASKEAGAKAWYNTAKKRGLGYLYKIFPQLRAGGRVANELGYPNGVPLDTFLQLASMGDKAFFDVLYPGEDAGTYIGRGFIQLTGKANYERIGKMIGIDLVQNPELVAENFSVASSALLAYIADSVGRGNYEKGIETLNSLDDYDMALKLVVANVASGGFGGDLNKVQQAFAQGSLAENKRVQLEKASKFSQEALTVASASMEAPDITPIAPSVQTASTIQEATQEVKQVTEATEEKEQQVIIQTAMASQPIPQIENQKKAAGANVGTSRPPAALIQKSYSDYFAVA